MRHNLLQVSEIQKDKIYPVGSTFVRFAVIHDAFRKDEKLQPLAGRVICHWLTKNLYSDPDAAESLNGEMGAVWESSFFKDLFSYQALRGGVDSRGWRSDKLDEPKLYNYFMKNNGTKSLKFDGFMPLFNPDFSLLNPEKYIVPEPPKSGGSGDPLIQK